MQSSCVRVMRIVLATWFAFVAVSGVSAAGDPDVPDISYLYADKARFLTVTNGMSLANVMAVVGGTARHGFTVQEDGAIHVLVSYDFDNGVNLSLVFRDGRLSKIIQPQGCPELLERYPYKGTTATRTLPWTIDQAYSLIAVRALETPPLSAETVRNKLAYSHTGEPQFPSWLVKGLVSQMAPRMKQDYATNRKLIENYNGLRVQLGMTPRQVEDTLGRPLHITQRSEEETVGIYGQNVELAVNPLLVYSCVAVVFREGKAARVFSRGTFCKDWLQDKNIVKDERGTTKPSTVP